MLAAEAEAKEKKRKALGLPTANVTDEPIPDDEASKRRKLLQDVVALDRDEDDAEEGGDSKSKADDEDAEEEEDSEEEDDTEELLKELEKIKRERAAEKERKDQEQNEKTRMVRDEEIATANPLLNLAAALGHESAATGTGTAGTFAVKRRWDDGKLHVLSRQLSLSLILLM